MVREPAATERLAVAGPGAYLWDGRFVVTLAGQGPWAPGRFVLAALDADAWRKIAADAPQIRARPVPGGGASPVCRLCWILKGFARFPT